MNREIINSHFTQGTQGNHRFLGTQNSSTFYDSGIPWNIVYGSGDIAGTIVKDDIALGDFILKNHIFGVAHTEGTNFASQPFFAFDGIMGFAKQASQAYQISRIEASNYDLSSSPCLGRELYLPLSLWHPKA